MSNAAPPAWVLALPLDSGQWRFLSRAWGWGPFKNSKPDAPPLTASVRVTASNATIGARSGQSKGAASKQASKLCVAGWARRNADNSLTLAAWRAPGVFELEAAVARGLVRRADDGKLTWPDTLQGGTPPPTGLGDSPHGSTPTGLDPTPHREGGHPPQEPSHPPQGVQSYESSLSSFGHEVEARDPHDTAPTPPKVKPDSPRLQARKPGPSPSESPPNGCKGAASAHTASSPSPSPSPVDPWPARVREASEGAYVHLEAGSRAYESSMREARADYGDAGVLELLRLWEKASFASRPPAYQVWFSDWRPWVRGQLGITAPKPEATTRPGQFALSGALRRIK